MKKEIGTIFRQGVALLCAGLLIVSESAVFAQALPQPVPQAVPEMQIPANQTAPVPVPEQTGASTPLLAPAQLDSLVAPLALYPDPLLSQILVASTYPLEIVEAEQWIQQNPNLSGPALENAAKEQNWDPSIQALVAFPDVLRELSGNAQWTTQLGNAFLAQQSAVMDAVQRLRTQAVSSGKLQSTPQEVVTTETQGDNSAVEIEPANPQVIYVPEYDPMAVWGPPAYYPYPVLSYPYYPYFGAGIGFGAGIMVGAFFGGWGGWFGWGWHPNWFGRSVMVNNLFFHRYGFGGALYARAGFGGVGVWAHNPMHRLSVPYPTRQLASQYHAAARMPSSGAYRGASGAYRSAAPSSGYARGFASRLSAPASGYRGSAGSFAARSASPSQGYRGYSSAPRFESQPRYSAPAARGYSAPAARGYSAPAARGYSAPAARSYSAPAARGFSGGRSGGFSGGHGGGGHGRR